MLGQEPPVRNQHSALRDAPGPEVEHDVDHEESVTDDIHSEASVPRLHRHKKPDAVRDNHRHIHEQPHDQDVPARPAPAVRVQKATAGLS